MKQNIRPDKFIYSDANGLTIIKKANSDERQETEMTDLQRRFIWLAFADKMKYPEIAKLLDVSTKDLSTWAKKFEKEWRAISVVKNVHTRKKIGIDFKTFYEWHKTIEDDKKCFYCGITESEIELLNNHQPLTKRLRGKNLELDRREPNLSYDDIDNLVYSCYWCNNAKTDTFTDKEFQEIGKVISSIWRKRLGK